MRNPGLIKRGARVGTQISATVVTDGDELKVTVTDISSGGFRLTSATPLKIGEYVHLRVKRYGDFPAQIRWSLGGESGGVFLEPVKLR